MLQRESVRLAYTLGLEPNYNNTDGFKFTYRISSNKHELEYRDKCTYFSDDDLGMSLSDLSQRIIYPFLLSCLTDDLKFIHLDCS